MSLTQNQESFQLSPIDFSGCEVFTSQASPFARRVRIALHEAGIPFETRLEDVFKPSADLLATNPLGRVPVVKLRSGKVLAESHLILTALREGRELESRDADARWESWHWSALAMGLAEKTVEYYISWITSRDTGAPLDAVLLEEFRGIKDRVLPLAEAHLKGEWFAGGTFSQADIDWGTALTYLSLRDSPEWKERFPKLRAFVDRVEARESFVKTAPPSPVTRTEQKPARR